MVVHFCLMLCHFIMLVVIMDMMLMNPIAFTQCTMKYLNKSLRANGRDMYPRVILMSRG